MIDGIVILEHVGMRQHSRGHVVQRNRVDVRHVVQLSEVVGPAPFRSPVRVRFRQIKVVLRVIQYL